MFVELKNLNTPRSITPNPYPTIASYIIGELTPTEKAAYDDALLSGLDISVGKPSTSSTPSASDGSALDLQ